MLHILGGVDRPTKGKVYIKGTDIYSLNNNDLAIFRRRNVGLIYQFYTKCRRKYIITSIIRWEKSK